ncbi:hypothetical protein BHM03_00054591 [Ensete ventricosum]|nr:hypothetical protein BHM03_00054591 [Ensete ventricosum]
MWISRNRVRAMENMHQKSRGEQRAHRVLVHIQVRRIKQEQEKIKHRLQAEVAMKPVFRGPSPPLCASSPTVVSGRSRSSARWMDPPCPTQEVGYWSGGVWVGRRHLSSGRAPTPARRSGRISSRRDPSDGQVSVIVNFAIPWAVEVQELL